MLTTVDAHRIDESLAKGLVKRLLREGHKRSWEVSDDMNKRRIRPGKTSIGVQYRERIKAIKRSMGLLLVTEFTIVKQLRGKPRETARAVIGIDTHKIEAPSGHYVSLLILYITRKTGKVAMHPTRIRLSVHMLERLIVRYQIHDLTKLRGYLNIPCAMGVVMSSARGTVEQGRYLVMGDEGLAIVELIDDTVMVVTWVPRSMWVAEQKAFYNAHQDGYSCLVTMETYMHEAKPVTRRRELDVKGWGIDRALLVEY